MPELPEVETVRRTLAQLVLGKKIEEVRVLWPKMVKKPAEAEQFIDALKGQTIHEISRRGKFLKFILDDYVLVSHLRMEGRYGLYSNDEPYDKHTHVFFTFTDNTELRYKDVRKFGTMHLFKKGVEEMEMPLSQLGPEPFSEEFTEKVLKEGLMKTNRKVKVALLDQKIVVGLGNIYVDEALFRAGIHPEREANSLKPKEIKKLHQEIVSTLQEAVNKGGSTIRSYVNTQGEIGMFQLELFVYGRKAEPCKHCGTSLEKIVVGGRGTHFCPKCQRLK
ncbi:DNA-formamidopyrimidine glycosylase [Bacillus luteolus]|uniref:Formamidopyrimidine-DNA glycosylase n=1 Tax=Litchfieldia luteola TaxID=682179 RepID=A0ABR9QIB7_9BACI|nr:DNA-formamidopyrimidine glycosylase [Cytobacillus luteolus]MBE4908235.1 DNA-formamidopyrimidine glycosylase [Cytobacillus luteolus]MBP1943021.1 formamidopyrimidine-DNA glycosylase [Cytobacillus luteolus]